MLFANIKHHMSRSAFREAFPDTKDVESLTLSEKISGRDIVYHVGIKNDAVSSLHLSLNGDFVESEYLDITAIALSLIEAQSARGISAVAEESPLLPWKELIQSPLPDTGTSDDRYIEAMAVKWQVPGSKINLSYRWIWPGQLSLEYSEEPA